MKKNIFSAILFLAIATQAFGQNFTATVLDKDTQLPMPKVQVYFVELKTETETDENGVFCN